MLAAISSLLASGALGAILKVVAALFQGYMDRKQQAADLAHRERIAEHEWRLKRYRVFQGGGPRDPSGPAFTRWTRRLLALSVTWTFCATALICTWYPDVPITVYQPAADGSIRFLWGLIAYPIKPDQTLTLTTGAIAWAQLHIVALVLSAYFMPVGNK